MKKLLILVLLSVWLFPYGVYAAMSSTNYTIYADSIGFDGGSFSTSTSYSLQDTIGDMEAATANSATYALKGGYQAADRGDLSLNLSSTSLNLGALSAATVSLASTVATVTSFSNSGYTLIITDVSGTMPSAVSDGAVTAGAEEYGVSAEGGGSQIAGDVAVTSNLTVALSTFAVANQQTTLIFKASKNNNSASGSFSQSMNLTMSANF